MRLRDLLLSTRTIDATVLAQAEAHATQAQMPLVRVLVAFNVVDGRRLARLLSRALHFELIDVAAIEVHPQLLQVVPRHAAERLRVLPIGVKQGVAGSRLYLAMADPTDDNTVTTVETATGLQVEPMVCDDSALQGSFDKHYGVVIPDAPILVGDLVGHGNHEFLTDSTAEALRFVHTIRSADVLPVSDIQGPTIELSIQRRPASIALGGELTVETRLQRPASIALGEWSHDDDDRDGDDGDEASVAPPATESMEGPELRTTQHTRQALPVTALAHLDDPTVVPDEVNDPFEERTDNEGRVPAALQALPRKASKTKQAVIIAAAVIEPILRAELRELIGPVEIFDDAVAACHAAAGNLALVLIEPQSKSPLLRALLDLEEVEPRPRIIVIGGDPTLRLLAFVDHHADTPTEKRAIAIAVVAALRYAGVDV
jgi:hypothetical protein